MFKSVEIFKGAVKIKEELITSIEKKYANLLENGILEDKIIMVDFCSGSYNLGSLDREELDKIGKLILENVKKELEREGVELEITYMCTSMYRGSFNSGLEFYF